MFPPASNIWEAVWVSLSTLVPPNINNCLSVCPLSAVWVQGEKHQEEKSQHRGVCGRRESQLEEKEKSEWPFLIELYVLLAKEGSSSPALWCHFRSIAGDFDSMAVKKTSLMIFVLTWECQFWNRQKCPLIRLWLALST